MEERRLIPERYATVLRGLARGGPQPRHRRRSGSRHYRMIRVGPRLPDVRTWHQAAVAKSGANFRC